MWALVHVTSFMALSISLSRGGAPSPTVVEKVVGPAATIMVMVLTPILTMLDRYRVGALLMFGNMGYGARWLVLSTIIGAASAEVVLHVVVRFAATGAS